MRSKRFEGLMAGVAGIAVLGLTPNLAQAMPLDFGDGWQGNWNTTLSVGSTWRAQSPDSELFKRQDGAVIGLTNGTGGSTSDSNTLNYGKGDRVSTIFKLVTDLEVKRDEMGGIVRVKAWHDQALSNSGAAYGNMANGYTAGRPLSDDGMEKAQRFEGIQLLDAYVYNTFEAGNKPLQVRLGRQVINWGESLFFQGVNQISPLDVPALRRPGSEIKEGLMPVWAADANLGLGGGASVEGFVQLKWEPTTADACGTYWSQVDISVSANAGNCNKIVVGSGGAASSIASGSYAPLVDGKKPNNTLGEFGLAVKLPVDRLDTEFGFYGMNIDSRTPIISARTGSWGTATAAQRALMGGTLNPLMVAQSNLGARGVKAAAGYWEYPEDIQVYGVSAATNLGGWSLGAEISYIPNLPVQINPNDVLNGLLTGKGPMAATAISTAASSDINGYDRLQKGQVQLNGVKTFGGILGAAKTTFMGEVAAQLNDAPDYKDGNSVRYGRSFIFGTASSNGYNTCANGANSQADGCQNDGFVTPFAWGYRLRGQLEFPLIFDTPITFIPSLSLAHDVSGYSADGQMLENRVQVGLGSRFTYERRYNLDVNYVYFGDWAKYDPMRDHDYISMSISATF